MATYYSNVLAAILNGNNSVSYVFNGQYPANIRPGPHRTVALSQNHGYTRNLWVRERVRGLGFPKDVNLCYPQSMTCNNYLVM